MRPYQSVRTTALVVVFVALAMIPAQSFALDTADNRSEPPATPFAKVLNTAPISSHTFPSHLIEATPFDESGYLQSSERHRETPPEDVSVSLNLAALDDTDSLWTGTMEVHHALVKLMKTFWAHNLLAGGQAQSDASAMLFHGATGAYIYLQALAEKFQLGESVDINADVISGLHTASYADFGSNVVANAAQLMSQINGVEDALIEYNKYAGPIPFRTSLRAAEHVQTVVDSFPRIVTPSDRIQMLKPVEEQPWMPGKVISAPKPVEVDPHQKVMFEQAARQARIQRRVTKALMAPRLHDRVPAVF